MNWDMIGALGEIAGATAVVVSLVYLARQIAISNRLARAEAWRMPNSDLNSLNAAFGVDPVFRGAFRELLKGADRSDLESDQRLLLGFYLISVTGVYEQLYREVREGILDDNALDDFGAKGLFALPFYRSSWPLFRPNLGSSFVTYFEERHGLKTVTKGDPEVEAPGVSGKGPR